ncbi:MAG: hypothetical protein E6J42_00020 [Chloroflexi bacterium]|nr:MAG: hypothetical protein E6J42_00020 [Chloroflexota bacterium]
MFNKARWRLTLWFAAVVAVILVVIGGAVYFTARTSLFRQVNSDLEAHAQREVIQPLANRQLDPGRQSLVDIATAGGYFYAITGADGQVLQRTPNTDVTGLAAPADLSPSAKFIDTRSSDGDHLRIYLQPVQGPRGNTFFVQVGRSTEPERTALNRLVLILAAGGGAGLMLAFAGGFLLAGRALAPIQTAVAKQRQFVADASHELRTPLALIRANAELLERDAVKPVAANITSVHDIIGETDRLSALVGQMLTLASADAGQEPAERVPVELGALAADAVREMRLLSAEKQVSINAHADGPAIVEGDPLRLRQLLTILVDNSIKYSPAGAAVDVRARAAGERALLQVTDNGRGIPAEAVPQIFERFYRVDKARSREMGGAGLGLSIARWIAETHGGSIDIQSEPGKGTTVTVALPLASADLPGSASTAPQPDVSLDR